MSGSEKRQRGRLQAIRFNDAELAALHAAAERAGLTVGAYIRQTVLGAPPPRQSRRPPVEKEALARILAQVGKIGSNVNQLAHHANAGSIPDSTELQDALLAVLEMRDALVRALGVHDR